MTSSTYVSQYERRVTLVVDALREAPDAAAGGGMSEDAARALAVRVLQAIDHIPETVR